MQLKYNESCSFFKPKCLITKRNFFLEKEVKISGIDSKYNNHPPHSTVINVDVRNYHSAIIDIKKSIKGFEPFEIIIDNKSVFWDDELTNGHTLYFGIKKNTNLLSFQKLIAESLKVHKIKSTAPHFIKNNQLLYDSFENYGFPFIGSHWIPHFTIASLKTSKADKLIQKFLTNVRLEKMPVNSFSIWIIKGEQHKEIEKVNLL